MKWFYIIAAAVAIGLSITPLWLLHGGVAQELAGQTVLYDTYNSKIKSLDPATCGDTTSSAILQGPVFEPPYDYHFLKRPIELIPQLAQAMPDVSSDHLTYTIHLKPGVKYHRNECFGLDANGEPRTREVKAEDFVLAFKRIADYHITTSLSLAFIEDKVVGVGEYRDKTRTYAKGDFSRYDLDLEGVKALDEHTLQIRLVTPFPQLVYVLAVLNYAPIPREVVDYHLSTRSNGHGGREPIPLEERDPEIRDAAAMVGTGPFYVAKFEDAGDIILRRNPDYRPAFYPAEGEPNDKEAGLLDDAGKALPLVDAVYYTFVQEINPAWMLFKKKQSDVSGIPRTMFQQVITPGKELTDEWARQGIRLIKYTSPDVYWIAFNMDDKVLGKSKSLRQALCLAFDVEQYIHVLHNDRGVRAVNVVPSGLEAHDEAGPSPYARFDLAAAKAKLEQARQELIAAGVIGPAEAIPPLTLDMGDRGDETRRFGEFAKQQFSQIGVDLNIELNDWPGLQYKVDKKQVQLYSMGWVADYPDPENFLQLFYSPNITRGTNNTNYSNGPFDALYKRASLMMPSPERRDLYVQMIRILNEDCPMILLSEPISFILVHPWVYNVKPAPFGYGNLKYRRIDAAARRQAGGR